MIELLKPTGRVNQIVDKPSTSIISLENKVIGFLDNKKPNFDLFLNRLEDLLPGKYQTARIIRREKVHAAVSMGTELLKELSEKCDVVITGSGD